MGQSGGVFSSLIEQPFDGDFLPQCEEICYDKCLNDCRQLQEGPDYLMAVASGDG